MLFINTSHSKVEYTMRVEQSSRSKKVSKISVIVSSLFCHFLVFLILVIRIHHATSENLTYRKSPCEEKQKMTLLCNVIFSAFSSNLRNSGIVITEENSIYSSFCNVPCQSFFWNVYGYAILLCLGTFTVMCSWEKPKFLTRKIRLPNISPNIVEKKKFKIAF